TGGAATLVTVAFLARIDAAVAAQRGEGDGGIRVVGRCRPQPAYPVVAIHPRALGAFERAVVGTGAQRRAEGAVAAAEAPVGEAVDDRGPPVPVRNLVADAARARRQQTRGQHEVRRDAGHLGGAHGG